MNFDPVEGEVSTSHRAAVSPKHSLHLRQSQPPAKEFRLVKNGLKALAAISAVMPPPVSATVTSTYWPGEIRPARCIARCSSFLGELVTPGCNGNPARPSPIASTGVRHQVLQHLLNLV